VFVAHGRKRFANRNDAKTECRQHPAHLSLRRRPRPMLKLWWAKGGNRLAVGSQFQKAVNKEAANGPNADDQDGNA
jgi:hypothetical protein